MGTFPIVVQQPPTLQSTASQEVRSLGVDTAAPTTAGVIATGATGGTDTAAGTKVTTSAVTSGTAFTPSASVDSDVYLSFTATTATTVTVSIGPSATVRHTLFTALTLAVAKTGVSFRCKAGWSVIATVSTPADVSAIAATVVTC